MHSAAHNDKSSTTPMVFDYDFQSSEMAVRDALEHVLATLEPLNLDVEETGTVELVMAEVLNNIVEHAYADRPEGGPVHVRCSKTQDGLTVFIKDAGKMMPDGKLPTGTLASLEVELDDLPEGGFGWFLIQNLAKDVTYERVGNQNVLKMRIVVGL